MMIDEDKLSCLKRRFEPTVSATTVNASDNAFTGTGVCAVIIVTVVIGFWAPCLQSLYMLIGDNLLLTRIRPYGIICVNLLSVCCSC